MKINGQEVQTMSMKEKQAHTVANALSVEAEEDGTLVFRIKMDAGGWPTKSGHRGVAMINPPVDLEIGDTKIGFTLMIFEYNQNK